MKTQPIDIQIKNNYKHLSELAYVQPKEKNVVPVWSLSYKYNDNAYGFVNQLGYVRTPNSVAQIKEDMVLLRDKPCYYTIRKALKEINKLLENIIKNINKENVVQKTVLDLHCFSKEAVERLNRDDKILCGNGVNKIS